jgi:hypothetical protein
MEKQLLLTSYKPIRFYRFICQVKVNRIFLAAGISGMLLQFIIFKQLYPFADFFSDSYSYIYAASAHRAVNIWPIGYSWFLAAVHTITDSDTALVFLQYVLLGLAFFYFFFSILYFYRPSTGISVTLFLFLFFNPLFLYLSNYVSSDALFLTLSLCWLTQLLWIIYRPRPYQVITHTLLLSIAFTVRYNALYYPLISIAVFIFSLHVRVWKITGIFFPLLLIAGFISYTRQKNFELTGERQFSIFGNWQLANNALFMFSRIQVDSTKLPLETLPLHRLTQAYFNSVDNRIKTVTPIDGSFYIKYMNAPLKQYLMHYWLAHPNWDDVQAWGAVAPVYGAYGKYLIRNNPLDFARCYLAPNTYNYFLPPLEKLALYNTGQPEVDKIAQDWFHYPSRELRYVSLTGQGSLLFFYPSFFLLINLAFLAGLAWLLYNKAFSRLKWKFRAGLFLIGSVLLTNAAFSIMASPIVFRYQVFVMIIAFPFVLFMLEIAEKAERSSFVEPLSIDQKDLVSTATSESLQV